MCINNFFSSDFEPSPMVEGVVEKAYKQQVKFHDVSELSQPKRAQV